MSSYIGPGKVLRPRCKIFLFLALFFNFLGEKKKNPVRGLWKCWGGEEDATPTKPTAQFFFLFISFTTEKKIQSFFFLFPWSSDKLFHSAIYERSTLSDVCVERRRLTSAIHGNVLSFCLIIPDISRQDSCRGPTRARDDRPIKHRAGAWRPHRPVLEPSQPALAGRPRSSDCISSLLMAQVELELSSSPVSP